MKNLLLILLIISCLTSVKNNEYCEGWRNGYVEGWCYDRATCLSPTVPLCPIPTLNCSNGYKCGYNRGFLQALNNRN